MLAAILTFSSMVSAQDTEEFKPSGKLFGLFFTDFHNTFSAGRNVSVFEVTRSYFGYEYSYSKTISGRILIDATTQTIDGKVMMTGYLRNAYLQYDNGRLTVRAGLIGSEQISMAEKSWGYRYIAKPVIDASGMIFPVDLGFLVKYKVSEMVTFDLSVVNGRGYKDITPDTTFRLASGITFTPVKNLLFRGYYDIMGQAGTRQWTASFSGAYIGSRFTLGAEYLIQNNHLMTEGHNYSGVNIFTSLKLKEKYSLFGRFENFGSVTVDGETEPWNLNKDGSKFIFGFDYSPTRGIRISPNFIGLIPDDNNADFVGTVALSFEGRF